MTNENVTLQDRLERFAIGYVIGHDDVENMDINEFMSRVFNICPKIEEYLKGNNRM